MPTEKIQEIEGRVATATREEAIAITAKVPGARSGSIEVQPITMLS